MPVDSAALSAASGSPPRVNIVGIGVSAITMTTALAKFDAWIAVGVRRYVCVADVHAIMQARANPDVRLIQNRAGMVTPDGMPLVWLAHWRGHPEVSRVYGPDLMLAVCEHSVKSGYRHFFYGGAEGVADELARRLVERFPGLQVSGTSTPPFRALTRDEEDREIETLNGARADFIWVGLGTPKQERWMAARRARLTAPILIGVGAAFDFHSGRTRQAPRVLQRHGLEWAFRLATEPRRLWRRYAWVIPGFIGLVALQTLGLPGFELPRDAESSAADQRP
jgi:N-acetylglucosaminyldiphosphoundecaprenol N-acetyl-beta-D-mannosaminyltransferase